MAQNFGIGNLQILKIDLIFTSILPSQIQLQFLILLSELVATLYGATIKFFYATYHNEL